MSKTTDMVDQRMLAAIDQLLATAKGARAKRLLALRDEVLKAGK